MKDLVDYLRSLDSYSAIVGVGNPLRGDDGFGPELANQLMDEVPCKVVDAGDVPEDYLEQVIALKPTKVLIADAVAFGGKPGDVVLLDPENLGKKISMSTHKLSLMMFIRYLRERLPRADVKILGVQPRHIDLGKGLSTPVRASIERLVDIIATKDI